ncbi:MAG: glycosyltransferase family 39 protein, partial [Candidatus Roizmanbacteria bacterium]|nr:glycosyltransferase family 39 protein [Candidatus Roizmanbacteria bacterium]
MKKINGKVILLVVIWLLVIGLLVYSRFTNLGWGLPYPMHPDERNMGNALQSLKCEFSIRQLADCFNPHFFAYGQFPLYLGYLLIWILKGFKNFGTMIISFEEAVISLRVISAMASVINAIIIIKIIKNIIKKNSYLLSFISYLLVIFSPFFIQFSHFGTTESLLMLFYSLIIYLSMQLLKRRTTYEVVWLALVSGLAIATKVSSIIFIAVPLITILSSLRSWDRYKNLIKFGLLTTIFMTLFSPHNLINFRDFASSIRFESDVALGRVMVFYTRQFFNTVPVWFQLMKIFPYALGWAVFILGSLGVLGGLGWKDRKINLLRFAILVYFIPNAFLFAKWSRFMAPVFPLMLALAILFLLEIRIKIIKIIIVIIAILPGIAYLSVYQNPDVRF